MDNSKLYQAVFQREKPYIDTNNTHTIVVNCGWENDRYQRLMKEMDERIGQNWYSRLEVEQTVNEYELEYKLSNLQNTNFTNHFLLLLEHTNCTSETTFKFIQLMLKVLNHAVPAQNRKVSVVMVLETTQIADLKREILDELNRSDIDVYLYNELEETKDLVVSAALGIVIAGCYSNNCKLSAFKNQTAVKIDNLCTNGFGPGTAIGELIANGKISSIRWISLACKWSDQSNEYLENALRQLIEERLQVIDEKCFIEAADTFYDEHFRHVSVDNGCLMKAVNNIPMIQRIKEEYDQIKLEKYFRDMYGSDGITIVNLSLKITLAKNLNDSDRPEKDIKKALQYIYDRVIPFGVSDLYRYMTDSLTVYKERLRNIHEKETQVLTQILERSTSNPQKTLADYVSQYQKIFLLQKRIEFWSYLEMTYSKENWAEYHKKSNQFAVQLTQMKEYLEQCTGRNYSKVLTLTDRRFTPYELLNPEGCEELCDILRSSYSEHNMASDNTWELNALRWLFCLNQHPNFQDTNSECFVTVDQRYQINIHYKCGKYLISG